MNSEAKQLYELEKGDYIRYNGTEWYVKRKDLYSVSPQYMETQWTLLDRHKAVCYLIRVMEYQKGKWDECWIMTRQIPLNKVDCQTASGGWEPIAHVVRGVGSFTWPLSSSFQKKSSTESAPQRVRYGKLEYTLHAHHEAKARDDHGAMVPKITWDYLDQTGQRNLAIEIWREPDKDYPEAYDGVTIDPRGIEQIQATSLRRFAAQPGYLVGATILAFFGLFAFIGGAPFDQYLALLIPIWTVALLMAFYVGFAWTLALAVGAACAAAMLVVGSASMWTIGLVCIPVAILVPPLASRMLGRPLYNRPAFVAWSGFLPAVWIYSFMVYFNYAPGPHEGYHLAVTCLIPLLLTAICYLIALLMGVLWPSRD